MPSTQPVASPLFPRSALHPAALAWADARARDGAPWCVAFSGGADSLALLLTLRELFPAQKLIALHFNHHLRGAASDGDEQFCRETCATPGVEFHAGHWQHAPRANAADSNVSEADARENRHAFFDREMSTLGATALWLGHQRDDIAETQLMRLARGSGSAGLAAPRPVHERADGRVFLRPLLTLSKSEITAALRARGLAWREDATNLGGEGGDFYRNRIRRDVLPAWIAAAENDALAGAALTRELLDEDSSALDTWLDELLAQPQTQQAAAVHGSRLLVHGSRFTVHGSQADANADSNANAGPNANAASPAAPTVNSEPRTANRGGTPPLPPPLDLRPLASKPRALLRRALRRWPPASDLARSGFESLLAICESPTGGRISIGQNIAIFENGILRIAPPPKSTHHTPHSTIHTPHSAYRTQHSALPFSLSLDIGFEIGATSTITLPDGATLAAAKIALTDTLRAEILSGRHNPIDTIFITLPPEKTHLTIRSWQPGDRYHPLGAPGSAKVSDLFINRKIPHDRRLTLPVVCLARDTIGEILWIPGLPPADAWKINSKTQQALHLTYQSGTCTVVG